ncbi:transcription antitermination factor NusB [Halanaerobacter jeridensis]|uniref:Transcription antitermination protein NusB n=1 Tax=Halanaerobacter jeridensis TaxID=706427 RepID=A0A939BPJ0_9FIRM|nr:transcription antitermination factor NusB [Halanaerobacter jeridensis]MBM7555234.1 N utilization substance protein B [Halanaerobacter jeridensis]
MKEEINRHQAREIAVQFLYQMDINQNSLEDNLNNLKEEHPELNLKDSFVIDLIFGVNEELNEIDKQINENVTNWKVKRMAKVDRNIIRLAVYEMLYQDDIPSAVSIDEAVELAKSFSNQKSAKFVNGVLGRLIDELELNDNE